MEIEKEQKPKILPKEIKEVIEFLKEVRMHVFLDWRIDRAIGILIKYVESLTKQREKINIEEQIIRFLIGNLEKVYAYFGLKRDPEVFEAFEKEVRDTISYYGISFFYKT